MKVAICGVWHVHTGSYVNAALQLGEVVGVWDEDVARGAEFTQAYNLPLFNSLDELLASDAEGVIIGSATTSHADHMVKIANAGKHIFTEKVMCVTEEECDRVAEAVKKNDVNFVVCMAKKYNAGIKFIKSIVDRGDIGTINFFRHRMCHGLANEGGLPAHFYKRSETGGGAMIDLGAHGMYLIDMFCGVPTSVKSVFTNACINGETNAINSDRVEDNAVTIMSFENGCIAISETGFVSTGYPNIIEIGGDKGTIIWQGGKTISMRGLTTGNKMIEVPIEGTDDLSPIRQFLTGEILPGGGVEEGRRLTHLMVEAYK